MTVFDLVGSRGHYFINLNGCLWLLDTGSPSSFGDTSTVTVDGEQCSVARRFAGLDASGLSELAGTPCLGLLGMDVLGRFDIIFDAPAGQITLSTRQLSLPGSSLAVKHYMRIPVVAARVLGRVHHMFFDTGAQFSYLQDHSLTSFATNGRVQDFYPGVGTFESETYAVDFELASLRLTLRTGALPPELGRKLTVAGATGILGNEVLERRKVGYFPRRSLLILG